MIRIAITAKAFEAISCRLPTSCTDAGAWIPAAREPV
jgi:hypothetical protein